MQFNGLNQSIRFEFQTTAYRHALKVYQQYRKSKISYVRTIFHLKNVRIDGGLTYHNFENT